MAYINVYTAVVEHEGNARAVKVQSHDIETAERTMDRYLDKKHGAGNWSYQVRPLVTGRKHVGPVVQN